MNPDPTAGQLEEFQGALQALGGSADNGKLREELGWPETQYEGVKSALLSAGTVVSGRGRSGVVKLAANRSSALNDGK